MRGDDPGDRRKLDRHFVEHEDLVETDFDVIIELRNDVNAAETLGDIERLVCLLLRDVALQHALHAGERLVASSCRNEFGLNATGAKKVLLITS